MAEDNSNIKAMIAQLLRMQATQNEKATETETEHSTELKDKLKNEFEPKPKTTTETETELNTEQFTELQHMGVLPNCNNTVTYSHDLPVTSLFTELENANALSCTDHLDLQHSDSDQRRTVDFFLLYLHYQEHDQGNVMERMESLFKQKSSSTAYKAKAQTLLAELNNFSKPTQHTRLMIFMRALIFSSDVTTQSATANMLKVYLATRNTDLQALQEYVAIHGSPPHIAGIDEMVSISGSPGMTRLSAIDNPKIFRTVPQKRIRHGHRVQFQDLHCRTGHESSSCTLHVHEGRQIFCRNTHHRRASVGTIIVPGAWQCTAEN